MDLDLTLVIQLTFFVSLLVFLNQTLFQPFLRLVEARHAKMHGLRQQAESLEIQSQEAKANYQQRLREAVGVAQKNRENLVRQGREAEREILTVARADMAYALGQARERIAHDAEIMRRALREQTGIISGKLVEKVLGRAVS